MLVCRARSPRSPQALGTTEVMPAQRSFESWELLNFKARSREPRLTRLRPDLTARALGLEFRFLGVLGPFWRDILRTGGLSKLFLGGKPVLVGKLKT